MNVTFLHLFLSGIHKFSELSFTSIFLFFILSFIVSASLSSLSIAFCLTLSVLYPRVFLINVAFKYSLRIYVFTFLFTLTFIKSGWRQRQGGREEGREVGREGERGGKVIFFYLFFFSPFCSFCTKGKVYT